MLPETTGKINFQVGSETFQTWYKVVGDLKSGARPLIVLHGGPGISHFYMLPHTELFTLHGIPVIFYDQIGIGASTHLPEKPKDFWTPDLFMDELDNVIAHFGIASDFDLLGHSWGGMLAAEYASTRHPAGLRRLVMTNAPASLELMSVGISALLEGLPEEHREVLKKQEGGGTTDEEEYEASIQVFYQKHICKLAPWPDDLLKSFESGKEDPTVYQALIGKSEIDVTGSLRTWSVIETLHTIACPTLVLNGREDEIQDVCVVPFFQKIPKVKWAQFVEGSHLQQFEAKERYFQVVGDFLMM